MKHLSFFVATIFVLGLITDAGASDIPAQKEYTSSIGMKLVRIEPGSFQMGEVDTPLPPALTSEGGTQAEGDFDESPPHTVRITKPFYIGIYEVTNYQYELFRPEHKKLRGKGAGFNEDDDAVINVNWYDAQAFCQWLCDKEYMPYRLPTEAEWEYACRAGTTTHYHTGDILPEEFSKASRSVRVGQTPPNAWGVYDMHGNIEEWCYDWYGPYEAHEQVDPIGRVTGDFRVTRGGSHSTSPYYLRSANRLGTVPEDKHSLIGFRVVIGEMPGTKPLPKAPLASYQIGVSQQVPSDIEKGPDRREPYLRLLEFVKMPLGNTGPLYEKHNHFTSVTECPNGDLLAIWHTCIGESGRELAVAASRLRYGEQQWEPASLFWDAPDRNDHGHALWFDGKDKIYHFQGLADQIRNVALVMRTSSNNGVSWSAPRIIAGHGPSRMPVESVFRTREGLYMISCDKGPNVLWISSDNGVSWYKSQGSIRGKHACAVQLADGRLMALGRERNIDGKMPMSISSDMGKSWEYSASEFPPVTWGQRAVLLRLKEGASSKLSGMSPLLFASFCKKMMVTNDSGSRHQVSGLFCAVSFDEGQTWPHKRLVTDDRPGRDIETLNGDPVTMSPHNSESVGYLSVCQTADNLVHLLTSRQHYCFNLKWLTTPPLTATPRPSPPKAQSLLAKDRLAKVYSFGDISGANRWSWVSDDFTQERAELLSSQAPPRITAGDGAGFYDRNEDPSGFAAVEQKNGFTVELKTQLIKRLPDAKGIDIELYDGAGSRYALAVTDTGVYWYEGYIQGSAFLPLDQFVPIAEGLDNTDAMHTYRIAVRTDRVAQIYRDGKFIAVKKCEYRTPRGAYIQLGLGPGTEALVAYFAYDLNGPLGPLCQP